MPLLDIWKSNRDAVLKFTIEQVVKSTGTVLGDFVLQFVLDVHALIILDAIIPLPDLPGFLIQSHDLHGQLPDARIKDTRDRLEVLDAVSREASKLSAVTKDRQELSEIFPGCQFLPHTLLDSGALVGLSFSGHTVLAEARSFWEGYHKLMRMSCRQVF